MKKITKDNVKTNLGYVKRRAKGKIHEAKIWVQENPEKATAIAGAAFAVAQYCGKAAIKDLRNNREAKLLKLRCYDPSKGHYYYLKRELSNKEWLMIDRRREAGEKLPDILEEMRVLK